MVKNSKKTIKVRNNRVENPKVTMKTKTIPVERIVFNFSFITLKKGYGFKDLDAKSMSKFLQIIEKLSSEQLVAVLNWPRETGIEVVEKLEYSVTSSEFENSERSSRCLDGYRVFRLAKLGRVIGRMYENIFYVLAIDTKFNLYKH